MKYIGIAMIVLFFAGLFAFIASISGIWIACTVFCAAGVAVVYVTIADFLIKRGGV